MLTQAVYLKLMRNVNCIYRVKSGGLCVGRSKITNMVELIPEKP
jgi:hypothetical protein